MKKSNSKMANILATRAVKKLKFWIFDSVVNGEHCVTINHFCKSLFAIEIYGKKDHYTDRQWSVACLADSLFYRDLVTHDVINEFVDNNQQNFDYFMGMDS